MSSSIIEVVGALVATAALLALWVIPVVLGVRWARRKGLSPHWMWFGLHPLFGWIAFWVIRYRAGNRRCASCGEAVPPTAKFCPHCQATQDPATRGFRWFQNQVACANCHGWVKLNTAFCPSCSAPAPRIRCPRCESENTTLVGGSASLVGGLMAAALAGSFISLFDQSLRRSQVFNYTKSVARALTPEILVYILGGVAFLVVAGVLLFGASGTRLKKVSCQKCGAKSPVPAEPSVAVLPAPAP